MPGVPGVSLVSDTFKVKRLTVSSVSSVSGVSGVSLVSDTFKAKRLTVSGVSGVSSDVISCGDGVVGDGRPRMGDELESAVFSGKYR